MKSVFILLVLCALLCAQSSLFLDAAGLFNQQKFQSIETAIQPPPGVVRQSLKNTSFGNYLRQLPLLPDSSNVLDFQNNIRVNHSDSSLARVIAINIKGQRLWQCMDILIRIHVDFLQQQKEPQKINYPLPEGTMLSWPEWQKGIRPFFSGLHFKKKSIAAPDSSSAAFQRYLNKLFEFSGTQTFFYYYPQLELDELQAGDFIVKKGKKGHAVMIVDLALNDQGERIALIGQGDTPACQFYLLKNKDGSPWFQISNTAIYPDLPIRKKMYWSGLRRF